MIFTDSDSLVFGLKGKTYNEAFIFSQKREEPDFAHLFDLDSVTEAPENLKDVHIDNSYWSMKNKDVMGKFKFEVLGIGEIGLVATKMNSILITETDKKIVEQIKMKLTGKCIDSLLYR